MTPNWSNPSFGLPSIAPDVGPFAGPTWLETWWNHRPHGDLLIAAAEDSLIALTVHENVVEFAGEADLTDYHSPLGAIAVPALTDLVTDLPVGTSFRLDSMPQEAADSVAGALRKAGLSTTTVQHEVAAVLALPDTFDDYLMAIGKKERHEIRRKRRRFDNEVGPSRVERRSGPEAVALFARLHRLSSGDKGTFMSDEIESFFGDLQREAGGVIDVLLDGSDRPSSAVFSFEDQGGFYLYNSAYEPEMRALSPGNVMLSHLIERTINEDKATFDFLKGDETYKFRLGATPRPLYEVTATVEGTG